MDSGPSFFIYFIGDIMKKDILNYKLVNFFVVLLIIFMFYETRILWSDVFDFLKPFIISIMISYVLNFYLRVLNKYFNKFISVVIFLLSFLILFYLFYKFFAVILLQLKDCINNCIYFLKVFAIKYNINIVDIYDKLKYFDSFIPSINIFSNVFEYISVFIIIFSVSIYLFIDFNKVICVLKNSFSRFYDYFILLNSELENYISSFFILIFINIFEYSFVFYIIGHPNYLFLGFLSGLLSIIPVIGGIITNLIALIMAFLVNYGLFIRTIIGILILSILDGYIISPIIYGHSNKIHPVLVIFSIFVGGKLMGLFGTIIALPVLVIIISTVKFLKNKKIG